ncbi:MAG: ATP-dependent DNA helicase RecG [Clostridiales bacterium]|nr:ATP-dependent DNA helicase RecG [Clostridiales bacterium]
MNLDSPMTEVVSVGEQRARKLRNLGITTVRDLVEHFPRDYEDRTSMAKISALSVAEPATFCGEVEREAENIRIRSLLMTRIRVKDESGSIDVVWFNQAYLKKQFMKGQKYYFTGKVIRKYGKTEVQSPEFERVTEDFSLSSGRIVPIYPATSGLSQKMLRSYMKTVLDATKNQMVDVLPLWIRKKYQLCEKNFAVQNIHFPETRESFFEARKRLVFEELFLLQMALFRIHAAMEQDQKGIRLKAPEAYEQLQKAFPFSLTSAQNKVLDEIKFDLSSGKRMNRLVQGDVGSGKTAVAMLAAFDVIRNGYQAVLMAPTEVLASQHYESFQKEFEKFQIKTVLLHGSMKKKEKTQALDMIMSGEAQMIIGTHAVIQKTVIFKNLALVITDEQHRFGVRQREALSQKGDQTHVLVMTATPIPRTLALILYGDLDISIIDELPPGRQKIDTMYVTSAYHQRIYTFIKKEVDLGRQVYIICPMVEDSDKVEVQAVISYTEELKKKVFCDYRVECLYGKVKPAEKADIMERFSRGLIDILVSTTVIEVGINVPNATIMLIENAERFGLAQLHQLRGRVGRGTEKSYCILVTDAKTKVAEQRMRAMKQTENGFEISELDLKLRGPGEFFGTRQHGLPEMKIANLYQDMKSLKLVQEAAQDLMIMDKTMEKEEHRLLKEEIDKIFTNNSINI